MAETVAKITIVGLDLIGISMGLSLRQNAGNYQVIGHDRDPTRMNEAKQKGGIGSSAWNLHQACENASLVITTEPLTELPALLQHIREDVMEGAVIFSIGSVMQPALEIAGKDLPEGIHFVAGRPVLSDISSQPEPRADLFNECTFCLGTSLQTDPDALELVSNLLARLGAKPFYMDATEHDGIVSAVEQLPSLLAAVIFQTAYEASGWQESQKLAGRRFALSTALDAVPEELAAALFANRDALGHRLDQLAEILEAWRTLLAAEDATALQKKLDELTQSRAKWEHDAKLRDWDRLQAPSSGDEYASSLSQMFFGSLFRGRRGRRNDDSPAKRES